MNKRAAHPFIGAVAALIAVLIGIWTVTVALVVAAGAVPSLDHADAIIVLGAAQYNGRPSPVLRARLDYSLALFFNGYARHMVFTGGVGIGDTLSEGEVARRYALAHGVPDSAIMVERTGMTSAESVSAAAALMRARGMHDALMVSDRFHMLRLGLLARRSGIRSYSAPTPVSRIDNAPGTRWRYVLRESVIFPAAAVLGGN
jgi:uncharacterized SAM-binding protein YcdF (DUF218 family)